MSNRPEIKQLDDICVQSKVFLNFCQRDSLLFILHDLFLLAAPELPSHNCPSESVVQSQPHHEFRTQDPGVCKLEQLKHLPEGQATFFLITTILPPALQGNAPVSVSKAALLPRTSVPRGTNMPVLSGPV